MLLGSRLRGTVSFMAFDPRTGSSYGPPGEGTHRQCHAGPGRSGLARGRQRWACALSSSHTDDNSIRAHGSDTRSLSEGYVQAIIQDSSGGYGSVRGMRSTSGIRRPFPPPDTPTLRSRPHASASPCVPTGRGRLWMRIQSRGNLILDPTTGHFKNLDSSYGFWGAIPVDMEDLPMAKSFSPGHME